MENPKINGCEIGSVSMLSQKCQKCMYRDYCKEKKNEVSLFNIPTGQQMIPVPYDTRVIPLSAGVSADEALEALSKTMFIMNRTDGR